MVGRRTEMDKVAVGGPGVTETKGLGEVRKKSTEGWKMVVRVTGGEPMRRVRRSVNDVHGSELWSVELQAIHL